MSEIAFDPGSFGDAFQNRVIIPADLAATEPVDGFSASSRSWTAFDLATSEISDTAAAALSSWIAFDLVPIEASDTAVAALSSWTSFDLAATESADTALFDGSFFFVDPERIYVADEPRSILVLFEDRTAGVFGDLPVDILNQPRNKRAAARLRVP